MDRKGGLPRLVVAVPLASAIFTIGLIWASPAAVACGVPITAEEIMHGRIPTEDNLPCNNSNRASRQGPGAQTPTAEEVRRNRERIRRDQEHLRRELQKIFQETPKERKERLQRQLEQKREEAVLSSARAQAQRDLADMTRQLASLSARHAARPSGQPANRLPAKNPFSTAASPAPHPTGPAKAVPIAPPVISPNPNPGPPPQYSGQSQSPSCSDITGLGGSPAATSCKTGDAALTQAQRLSQRNPVAARAKYQEAADAYRRAGDIAMANAIIAQMNALIASAPQAVPSENAGANPVTPSVPPAPPAEPAAPSPSASPTPPQGHQASLPSTQPSATPPDDAGSCPEAAPQDGWQDAAYCAKATNSCVDRGSALYGALCYPKSPPVSNVACPPGHADDAGQIVRLDGSCWPASQPAATPITFDALNAQALARCRADLAPEVRRTCIADEKLTYLIAHDLNVRAACAALADHKAQLACADTVYLYGPSAPWQNDLRTRLRVGLNGAAAALPDWVMRLTPQPARAWDHLPSNPCPVGQGVQPTPAREGGEGAWTCQPLTNLVLLADKPDAQPPAAGDEMPETADQVEAKMQDVATLIASVTAARAGAKLKPKDRAICVAVSYRAVLVMMKGGRTPVPPMCQTVVTAAWREFASYADHEFYTGSRRLDRLLALLDVYYQSAGDIFGGNLGAPQPGMSGLVPSAENRRQVDCIVAGGSLEECAKAAR